MKSPIMKAALKTQEAAHYLSVGKSDLDRARLSGELSGVTPPPFFRIGNRVRYRVKELDRWLEQFTSFPTIAAETAAQ